MSPADLLVTLHARGIHLSADGDDLIYEGDVTDSDLDHMRAHKAELLELATLADDERCHACPRPLEVFDGNGVAYCEIHMPESERWQLTHAQRVVEAHQAGQPISLPGEIVFPHDNFRRPQDDPRNRCDDCDRYPVFYVMDGRRLCDPCGQRQASRAVVEKLDATPIVSCRICRNDRGAHIGDDGLCTACRVYTRRHGELTKASPQDR